MTSFLFLLTLEADEIDLQPNFFEPALDLVAHGRLRLIHGVLVAFAVGYLLSPPPWRALVRYVRA